MVLSTPIDELIQTGRYDQARAHLLRGEQGNTDALAVLLELRDWLRAKEYGRVRKVLAQEGSLLEPYLEPTRVQAALEAFEGETETALEPYLQDPHLGGEAWCSLGLLRIRGGNHEGANQAFERALERDKGHFRAKTNRANLLQEEGRLEEAIAAYQEVLQLNPDYALAHHNLGAAYRKKGDLSKSVYHVKRAQRLQMRPPSRTLRASVADPNPLPRPAWAGLGSRWWVWLIVIAIAYFLLHR
ncbi:MAG: tetratricopeptide repeat protein [Thermaceae bacterium]|nr:tetratricopeptide repeat protein [Thermaceae bacterium]